MSEGATRPLRDRVVLVTGASRGIGYEAAKAFASAGAHVVAVARTVGGLEELDDEIKAGGGTATLVPLDLKDSAGIDRLGAAIFERWGRLDVLLANAAILGGLSPLGHVAPKVWDEAMAVNVTANWRLLRATDALLRRSDAGRVLVVSSSAAQHFRPFWGVYSVSKAAVEALARTYAAETANTGVRVALVNPGPMRTRMRAEAMPGEDASTLTHPSELAPHLVGMAGPGFTRTDVLFDFPSRTFRSFGAGLSTPPKSA